MKNISSLKHIAVLLLTLLAFSSFEVQAQSTTRLSRTCAGQNPVRKEQKMELQKDGNINILPCDGKNVLIAGLSLIDLINSNSGGGGGGGTQIITGTASRNNFLPVFASDSTISKSTVYATAALTRIFDTTGFYSQFDKTNKRFQVYDAGDPNEFLEYDANQSGFRVSTRNVRLGNLSGASARFELSDSSGTITTRAASGWTHLNDFTIQGATILNGNLFLNRTITPLSTTGDQTINKMAGTVNVPAGFNSISVTNSLVNANTLADVQARTNDATCYVKGYNAKPGVLEIYLTASCTATTSIGFKINN